VSNAEGMMDSLSLIFSFTIMGKVMVNCFSKIEKDSAHEKVNPTAYKRDNSLRLQFV
jgi:hypothetical protein